MTFKEKRQSQSIGFQLSNIGSEVSRCIKAKKNKNIELSYESYQRMLDLYSLTLSNPKLDYSRKKEILKSKEVICDFLFGNNEYKSNNKKALGYYNFFIK